MYCIGCEDWTRQCYAQHETLSPHLAGQDRAGHARGSEPSSAECSGSSCGGRRKDARTGELHESVSPCPGLSKPRLGCEVSQDGAREPAWVCVSVREWQGGDGKAGGPWQLYFPPCHHSHRPSRPQAVVFPSCIHGKDRGEEVAALGGERRTLTPVTVPCHQKGPGNSPPTEGHLSSAITGWLRALSSLTLPVQSNYLGFLWQHVLRTCVSQVCSVLKPGTRAEVGGFVDALCRRHASVYTPRDPGSGRFSPGFLERWILNLPCNPTAVFSWIKWDEGHVCKDLDD